MAVPVLDCHGVAPGGRGKTSATKHGLNDILAALVSAMQGKPDEVPPGWYTVNELAKIRNRSIRQSQRAAISAVEAGTLEQRTFRIEVRGRLYPVPHYRAKNLRA